MAIEKKVVKSPRVLIFNDIALMQQWMILAILPIILFSHKTENLKLKTKNLKTISAQIADDAQSSLRGILRTGRRLGPRHRSPTWAESSPKR
jgi:hypothetical protein